jgi:hypothetical protein
MKLSYALIPKGSSSTAQTFASEPYPESVQSNFLRTIWVWKLQSSLNVTPCSLEESYQRFEGTYCLFQGKTRLFYPEDEGGSFLRNTGKFLLDFTVHVVEDSNLHINRRGNLTFRISTFYHVRPCFPRDRCLITLNKLCVHLSHEHYMYFPPRTSLI